MRQNAKPVLEMRRKISILFGFFLTSFLSYVAYENPIEPEK